MAITAEDRRGHHQDSIRFFHLRSVWWGTSSDTSEKCSFSDQKGPLGETQKDVIENIDDVTFILVFGLHFQIRVSFKEHLLIFTGWIDMTSNDIFQLWFLFPVGGATRSTSECYVDVFSETRETRVWTFAHGSYKMEKLTSCFLFWPVET